ncbi:NHL repeat-containing protein [Flavobacterium sp.]|uniref:NHL repeat-containing protein n=1 Tax=Flavobacterium sp. TaxID=239 RepID=UPI00374D248F
MKNFKIILILTIVSLIASCSKDDSQIVEPTPNPPTIQVTTFVGGTQGSDDAQGIAAKFNKPTGIAIDNSGNIYVADYGNHKIRKISSTGIVMTLAGSTAGFADGTGTGAKFNGPSGIALDASGNVYVADSENQKIRKITPAGIVTTLAGSTYGYTDATGTAAQFKFPVSIVLDPSGNAFIGEIDSYKIRKITPAGAVTTFAGSTSGFQDGTATTAQFGFIFGISIDASGNLYAADSGNHKIRKISPTGVVSTLAGSTSGFANGTGASAQFNSPRGIFVDSSGAIYVADTDNHKIRKISATGEVTTLAGSTIGFTDGLGSIAQFSSPSALIKDSNGNIYIADRDNNRIRKITIN